MFISFSTIVTLRGEAMVFSVETSERLYDIFVFADGKEFYKVNGKPVPELPELPSPKKLRKVADQFKERAIKYLGMYEGELRNNLWWEISDGLKGK